jgi:hypothetical protein
MSVMGVLYRYRTSRLGSPDNAEMSMIWVSFRYNLVRLGSPDNIEVSLIGLLFRYKIARFVAFSIPVTSQIPLEDALREVRESISVGVGSEMPSSLSTTAFNLASAK